MSIDKKIKLLKIELEDRYVQENFKRLENYINKVIFDAVRDLDPNVSSGGGSSTTSAPQVWTKNNTVVYNATTKVVDLIPTSGFNSVKYHFTLYNKIEQKTLTFELTVIQENGTISDVLVNKFGSPLLIEVEAEKNVSNELEIKITNNNIFNLDVSYARLIL